MTMDQVLNTQASGQVTDDCKTLRMGLWSLVCHEDVRPLALERPDILGENRTPVRKRHVTKKPLSRPGMLAHLGPGPEAWFLPWVPDSPSEDTAKTCHSQAVQILHTGMQVATPYISPVADEVFRGISVMIAKDEPRPLPPFTQDDLERPIRHLIPQKHYVLRLCLLSPGQARSKLPVRITAEEDHLSSTWYLGMISTRRPFRIS